MDYLRKKVYFSLKPDKRIIMNNYIVSDVKIMMGKPVVAGTRITVEEILEKLSMGESIEQILEAHPRLTKEGIYAAIGFAKEALKADVIYPIKSKNK